MPLLSIVARFPDTNVCKVQLSAGSVPTARMRLKMYAIHLKKPTDPNGDGLVLDNSIPAYCLVSLDGILGNTQIHNALAVITKKGTGDPLAIPHVAEESTGEHVHQQNSFLTLPTNGEVTIQQCSIGVEVNQHIPRQITVKVMKYGPNNTVVDFPATNASKSTNIDHLQLWFEYARPHLL